VPLDAWAAGQELRSIIWLVVPGSGGAWRKGIFAVSWCPGQRCMVVSPLLSRLWCFGWLGQPRKAGWRGASCGRGSWMVGVASCGGSASGERHARCLFSEVLCPWRVYCWSREARSLVSGVVAGAGSVVLHDEERASSGPVASGAASCASVAHGSRQMLLLPGARSASFPVGPRVWPCLRSRDGIAAGDVCGGAAWAGVAWVR